MKEFIVEVWGNYTTLIKGQAIYTVRRLAGTPRIAASEVLKRHPEFGIRGNRYGGGPDRQLEHKEILTIRVRNRKDFPEIKFKDEER